MGFFPPQVCVQTASHLATGGGSVREPTCEGLGAGIDPGQPLGRAKIRYLQDAAVGVDEDIITLQMENTSGEKSTHSPPPLMELPAHGALAMTKQGVWKPS